MTNKKPLTYSESGVDIGAGERAVDLIKDMARSTYSPQVITELGGFGGLFSLKGLSDKMSEPVLVSGTDGVGTKLKIAFMSGIHSTVGIDAVAMCVNDVICTGARPLFFLDCLSVGRLDPESAREIISGVAEGCRRGRCSLIGGEMAELPGFYADGEYDIVGFCVGIVDRPEIVDGSKIEKGDAIIGVHSSGLHSNGFSLVRKVIFEVMGHGVSDVVPELGDMTVGEALLEPTMLYTDAVMALAGKGLARGIANITGGGIEGNINRVLPEGRGMEIDWHAWERPAVFKYIQACGNIEEPEMRRVFNCGIGMAFIVPESDAEAACGALDGAGVEWTRIGSVT